MTLTWPHLISDVRTALDIVEERVHKEIRLKLRELILRTIANVNLVVVHTCGIKLEYDDCTRDLK